MSPAELDADHCYRSSGHRWDPSKPDSPGAAGPRAAPGERLESSIDLRDGVASAVAWFRKHRTALREVG